ncbi:MAG: hypothetical protein IJX97_02245 [Clostridia bacterium]|nr:hypothetical protein [Clostridia bacterium]
MYTRSYYPEAQEKITLPDNYDGTAFTEQPPEDAEIIETVSIPKEEKGEDSVLTSLTKLPIFSGIFGKGGLFGDAGLSMPKLGTEEILIIATAAFLFFSKNGDKESALILLFLLLIN